MDDRTYRRFTAELVAWAEANPAVIGLVALGSMARAGRDPDEWSDHDFWVVAETGAAPTIRDDPTWLPDHERIVLFNAETEHGRNVIYDDGHLIEQAVFEPSEVSITRANDYRVMVDKGGIADQMAAIAQATAEESAGRNRAVSFGRFASQLVIGLTRYGRGEELSADAMIKHHALGNLLGLLGRGHAGELDSLDPFRRFELARPDLAPPLLEALKGPAPGAATAMLDLAAEHLTDLEPNTPELRTTLRTLIMRVAR
ncbi:MAG: hypothetical protein HKN74_08700 [Acidimicrobiia bacterium]|nr:hypothetical protein [Acidimicrobiia bacterium]NNF10348.1 hypothetical protein [Acidimicrobiia bacterium]NNL70367.1 hypothetical protein [Acidimicrobiia bacterium]